MANQSRAVAHSATGRTKHGLGWVPWLALVLLIALVAGGLLWALNLNDNNDEPGVDISNDSAPITTLHQPNNQSESLALVITGVAA